MLYIINMTTKNHSDESTNEIKRRHTAGRNSILVFALLLATLIAGSSTTVDEGALGSRDIAWITLSFIALCTIAWSLVVNYRQADERQQETQRKAAAVAFMAVMFGLFAAQVLHAAHVLNLTIAAQVLFIGGILIWEGLLWAFDRRIK